MEHNRPGYQLRKKTNEKSIVQYRIMEGAPPIPFHKEGYLLKGEKTDAQRQCDLFQLNARVQKEITVVHKEVEILKVEQQSQISEQACPQQYPSAPYPLTSPKQQADAIISVC